MRQPTSKPRQRSQVARFFLRGLITVLPIVLTIVVFGLLYRMVTTYVTRPINGAIYWSLEHTQPGWYALDRLGIDPRAPDHLDTEALPVELKDLAARSPQGYSDPAFQSALAELREDHASFFLDFEQLAIRETTLRRAVASRVHPLIGVVLSLLLVIWLGWLVGGFVGRRIVTRVDRAFHTIPVVRTVYPYSKQLVEFFLAEKKIEFDTVVAVPYPSRHLWSFGFVTSRAPTTLQAHVGREMVTCFVPSSPMPMTGYTIFVEASEVVPLPITVDEALRTIMTGGVLIPQGQQPASGPSIAELLHAQQREDERT